MGLKTMKSFGTFVSATIVLLLANSLHALIPGVTTTTTTTKKPKIGKVTAGPLEISSLGCGTWSWGNRLLFDYDPSQDEGIYEAYREIRNAGVTIFDTAGKNTRSSSFVVTPRQILYVELVVIPNTSSCP
jgi:hypothetical protein